VFSRFVWSLKHFVDIDTCTSKVWFVSDIMVLFYLITCVFLSVDIKIHYYMY